MRPGAVAEAATDGVGAGRFVAEAAMAGVEAGRFEAEAAMAVVVVAVKGR